MVVKVRRIRVGIIGTCQADAFFGIVVKTILADGDMGGVINLIVNSIKILGEGVANNKNIPPIIDFHSIAVSKEQVSSTGI